LQNKEQNIFIVAGETSGDIHASELVRQLRERKPELKLSGIGGQLLQSEKVRLIHNYKEINFIGFSSVVKNLSKIKSILSDTVDYIKNLNPEVVILVDFPGFNLKLAEKIRKFYNGKIVYFISPQLWAWHKRRVKKVRQYIDRMLVVFPFEADFYKKENIQADYIGHPLLKKIDEFLKKNKKTKSPNIRIGLLPGSRTEEVQRILPILADVSDKFRKGIGAEINILCPDNIKIDIYKEIISDKDFNLIRNSINDNENYKLILNSELLFSKSGTSTLECALIGTPFCVVYNTSPFNYHLAKRLIKVEHLAIVNILSGKKIVQEFIQKEMNVDNLHSEGMRIITDEAYREQMLSNLKNIKNIFGQQPAVSATDIICSYLK
jgi:lipid-A-disaccharide synthase